MTKPSAPQEVWIVCAPDPVGPDYVCTYPQGAHEHANDAAESAPELGPYSVVRYIRADRASPQVPPRNAIEQMLERYYNLPEKGIAPLITWSEDAAALLQFIHDLPDAAPPRAAGADVMLSQYLGNKGLLPIKSHEWAMVHAAIAWSQSQSAPPAQAEEDAVAWRYKSCENCSWHYVDKREDCNSLAPFIEPLFAKS